MYIARPRIGKRRNFRPLKPSHFFASSKTRHPGESGVLLNVMVVTARVGIVGTVKSVQLCGDDGGGSESGDEGEDALTISSSIVVVVVLLGEVKATDLLFALRGVEELLTPMAEPEETELAARSMRLARTSSLRQDRKML